MDGGFKKTLPAVSLPGEQSFRNYFLQIKSFMI